MSEVEVTENVTVRRSIVVRASIERAFRVFTERFDAWWPRGHHLGASPLEKVVLEGRTGGRWYERCEDGSECDWGKVLAWEPPTRVVLSWHLDGDWKIDPDPAHASRVEVTFHDDGDGATRVVLEHTCIERHGATWRKVRDGVGSDQGWNGLLALFGKLAESS